MKNILKLGLTLAIFAVVSCTLLALVNNWTAPKIAAHKAEKTAAGLKVVFPAADSFEEVAVANKKSGSTTIDAVYYALKGGEKTGYVVKATGATYDKATLLIGVDTNKKVSGLVFLEITDSPGFGQNAKEAGYKTSKGTTFYGQFSGLDASNGLVMNQDFEAISGATITSRGVETIVNDALKAISK